MRISEVSERTGISRELIHHYLRQGLLPKPETRAQYSEEQVRLLQQIKVLREQHHLPLEIIRGMGIPVREIRLSGGGARSRFWRQLQADIYGQDVVTINATEGPAFGVAILAMVGTGRYGTVAEACDATIRVGGRAFGLIEAVTWRGAGGLAKRWSVNLLVVALAGVGLGTRLRMLKGLGLKPFFVGICAAIAVGGVSTIAISLLGWFVSI